MSARTKQLISVVDNNPWRSILTLLGDIKSWCLLDIRNEVYDRWSRVIERCAQFVMSKEDAEINLLCVVRWERRTNGMKVLKADALCLSTCVVCVSSSDVTEEKSSGYMTSCRMTEPDVSFSFSPSIWLNTCWPKSTNRNDPAENSNIVNRKDAINRAMTIGSSNNYEFSRGHWSFAKWLEAAGRFPIRFVRDSRGSSVELYYQVIQTCLRQVLFVHQGQHTCAEDNRNGLSPLCSPHRAKVTMMFFFY